MKEIDQEYFRSIRQEITDRIKIHYTLLWTKLLVVGGVFSLLNSNQDLPNISPFLASSIFSFCFDIVMVDNLGWIRGAGQFIRKNIEDKKLTNVLWENYFAQPKENKWCFDIKTYIVGIWGIGFSLGFIGLITILPSLKKLWPRNFEIIHLSNWLICIAVIGLGIFSWIKIRKNLAKEASR